MHDEVTCEQCAKSCQLIYGKASDVQLADYMRRHHGTFGDCSQSPPTARLPKQPGALVRQGDDLYVNAAGNLIKLTSDPTLKPGEFRIEQDDTPIQWVSPARAVTVPSANVSTRCARCSQTLVVPIVHPWRPGAEVLNEVIAAHQERCFVAGEWVRWQVDERWHEGTVLVLGEYDMQMTCVRGYSSGYPFPMSFTQKNIRRIPRPQQGVAARLTDPPTLSPETLAAIDATAKRLKHLAAKIPKVDVKWTGPAPNCTLNGVPAVAPTIETPWIKVPQQYKATRYGHAPISVTKTELIETTKYDGVTGRECYERYVENQRSDKPLYMGPKHLAAARELWGLYLKAKIAASAAAERLQVRIDSSDPDDTPW